jgi:hypothetical protein
MLRRTALAVSAIALLAGCGVTATPTQTQLQTTAALVAAGVDAVAASVLATPNLSATTAAQINGAVTTVNAANQVIQQATTAAPTSAQQIVAAVKIAAPLLLATLNASSPEAVAINAALALLPTILAAAGVAAAAPAPGKTMDPAEAMLVLKGYTGK